MRDVLRTLSSGCQLLGRGADGQVEPREGGLGGKGSAAVAAGHLVSADPVERVGSYLEALKEGTLNIVLLNRQGGGGPGGKTVTKARR